MGTVRVKQPDSHRRQGSVVLSEGADLTLSTAPPETKLSRRTATISRVHRDAEGSDSSATEPAAAAGKSPNPNLRRKRFPPRLQSLRNSRASAEPVPPLPVNVGAGQTLDVPDDHELEIESATTLQGSGTTA